jgi:hypothetical protein
MVVPAAHMHDASKQSICSRKYTSHHLINTGRRDRVTPTRLQLPTKASPDLSPFVTRSLQEKAKGIKRCP